jgi:ribosomal protein S18 acetylase RimI-like enzyme
MSGIPVTLALRPATDADREFLAAVYASTRAAELAVVPWTDEQRAAFLAQQFHAQSVHYASYYADASFDVVLVDGEPAGRLIVDRRASAVHVVDIALLPGFRSRGIGTRLLAPLLAEARERGVPTSINVERSNRAAGLYGRLGFEVVADDGVYLTLERAPGDQAKIAS